MQTFDEMKFWEHWEKCKAVFEGMEKSLITAKQNNPARDYAEQNKKLQYVADIQGYLGVLQERYVGIKLLNMEINEKYVNIKHKLIETSKEVEVLKKEMQTLKENIT